MCVLLCVTDSGVSQAAVSQTAVCHKQHCHRKCTTDSSVLQSVSQTAVCHRKCDRQQCHGKCVTDILHPGNLGPVPDMHLLLRVYHIGVGV